MELRKLSIIAFFFLSILVAQDNEVIGKFERMILWLEYDLLCEIYGPGDKAVENVFFPSDQANSQGANWKKKVQEEAKTAGREVNPRDYQFTFAKFLDVLDNSRAERAQEANIQPPGEGRSIREVEFEMDNLHIGGAKCKPKSVNYRAIETYEKFITVGAKAVRDARFSSRNTVEDRIQGKLAMLRELHELVCDLRSTEFRQVKFFGMDLMSFHTGEPAPDKRPEDPKDYPKEIAYTTKEGGPGPPFKSVPANVVNIDETLNNLGYKKDSKKRQRIRDWAINYGDAEWEDRTNAEAQRKAAKKKGKTRNLSHTAILF